MKRTMLSSLTALMLLLAGFALAGCSSNDSHEHGSGDQNKQDMPAHQHSH